MRLHTLSFFFLTLLTVHPLAAFASGGASAEKKEDPCLAAPLEDEEAEKEAKKSCPQGPQYVTLGMITVPVLVSGKLTQYVDIVPVLEAPDYVSSINVKKYLPLLRDAYISGLYGAFSNGQALAGGVVDIDLLRSRLEKANERVLPAGLVSHTLLHSVNQRKN